GYRREQAKEKKAAMDTYWVPGVNHLGTFGRWAFAELTDVFTIASDFEMEIQQAFSRLIDGVTATSAATTTLPRAKTPESSLTSECLTGPALPCQHFLICWAIPRNGPRFSAILRGRRRNAQ